MSKRFSLSLMKMSNMLEPLSISKNQPKTSKHEEGDSDDSEDREIDKLCKINNLEKITRKLGSKIQISTN